MKAKIHVTLKNGVLDPQGSAIKKSLENLGLNDFNKISQGKYFEIELNSKDKDQATKSVDQACSKLLANTVIENYKFEIIEN
jgi:phosphoribosylformylglycinamidine synthase subunit PurS